MRAPRGYETWSFVDVRRRWLSSLIHNLLVVEVVSALRIALDMFLVCRFVCHPMTLRSGDGSTARSTEADARPPFTIRASSDSFPGQFEVVEGAPNLRT